MKESIQVKIARLEEKVDFIKEDIHEACETMKMTSVGMNQKFDDFNKKFEDWKDDSFIPLTNEVSSHRTWIKVFIWAIGFIFTVMFATSGFYTANKINQRIANDCEGDTTTTGRINDN